MKRISLLFLGSITYIASFAQPVVANKENICTPVKNQQQTGTCWCFSTTSLVESMALKSGIKDIDISEMYSVRNIYVEKAKNYVLRQGTAQFGEGGLGHDLIRAIATYGAMPEEAYTGLTNNAKEHNHVQLVKLLKAYLDSTIKNMPGSSNWLAGYNALLDKYLGPIPNNFQWKGNTYTPISFAKEVLHFNSNDYISLTSFTHHPFYQPFILEVPDNFANGSFYNLPLEEFTQVVQQSLQQGYTVLWDADVSNKYFMQGKGYATLYTSATMPTNLAEAEEETCTPEKRQIGFENLTTQDDHLMHIVGLTKNSNGKTFFHVKNSWGQVGPLKGFIDVSIPYFQMNTISVIVPKAALSKEWIKKLGL